MKTHFENQIARISLPLFWSIALFFNVSFAAVAREEDETPLGISIELLYDKAEGHGRPRIVLKNNTGRKIKYWSHGISNGWKIKVFDMNGELIGKSGYEPFTRGSIQTITLNPGEQEKPILDIRWGVLKDKNVPPLCRVEIETPPFKDDVENLSAKLTTTLKLLDDDVKK